MTSLDRLLELRKKATQGEWLTAPGNFIVADCKNSDPETGLVVAEVPCQGANDDDLPFIAALVNYFDLPSTQAMLEKAERKAEEDEIRLKEAVMNLRHPDPDAARKAESNARDAERWRHALDFGFPVRNQTQRQPSDTWVAFPGAVLGETPTTAIDEAIRQAARREGDEHG